MCVCGCFSVCHSGFVCAFKSLFNDCDANDADNSNDVAALSVVGGTVAAAAAACFVVVGFAVVVFGKAVRCRQMADIMCVYLHLCLCLCLCLYLCLCRYPCLYLCRYLCLC